MHHLTVWDSTTSTHHLLHTVPVHQSVGVSEVSLVVLVVRHHELATETHTSQGLRFSPLIWCVCVGCLLGLQEKLLVEGLVLVAPFVSAAPTGMASLSDATTPPSGFKGEVQQVVQANFLGSSKLSRAKLGPA